MALSWVQCVFFRSFTVTGHEVIVKVGRYISAYYHNDLGELPDTFIAEMIMAG
jgi:hypothetical protein